MDADVGILVKVGFELVPQLRRLVFKIQFKILITRRKIPFFLTRRLFIAPDTQNKTLEVVLLHDLLKAGRLERTATNHARFGVVHPLRQGLLVLPNDEIDTPLLRVLISKLDHFRDFEARVDMDQWDRHMTVKRLTRQPKKDIGVLSNRPKQSQLLELLIGFSQYKDGLMFEPVKVIHKDSDI